MKFYLAKDQQIIFKSSNGRIPKFACLKASLNISLPQTEDENSFLSDEDCLKLRDVLESTILNLRNASAPEESMVSNDSQEEHNLEINGTLHFELVVSRDEFRGIPSRKGHLRITRDFSEDWIEIIMNVAEQYSCEATMRLALKRVFNNQTENLLTEEIKLKKLEYCKLSGSTIESTYFSDVGTENDIFFGDFLCEVDIVIAFYRIKDDLSSFSVFAQENNTNREILHEEIGCDLSILTSDGIHVKCHKIFLLAKSNVFKTIFKGSFNESKTNVIEMPDMNEKSVRALLAYLYCNETKEAHSDCTVANDLLQAGHKYAIADLEDRMKYILLSKPDDWFKAEVAIRLFNFSRNIEGGEKLKLKAVKRMVCHHSELSTSQEYIQLYKEDPMAAMDFCNCAISLLKIKINPQIVD